jgi:hypothetical protein
MPWVSCNALLEKFAPGAAGIAAVSLIGEKNRGVHIAVRPAATLYFPQRNKKILLHNPHFVI